MHYSVLLTYGPAQYASTVEASTLEGAILAAQANVSPSQGKAIGTGALTSPVLVFEDGRVAQLGSHITSFRDQEWRLDGMSRPLHTASTGRVLVSRTCVGCADAPVGDGIAQHQYWCTGREQREFFPSVFGLTWVRPQPQHADYPHNPGALYDCPACQSQCFCDDMGLCLHCADQQS